MKIPTARVSGRYFFAVNCMGKFVGSYRRANAVRPYMGLGFYPLVFATKKYVM